MVSVPMIPSGIDDGGIDNTLDEDLAGAFE